MWSKNESVANKRTASLVVYKGDGMTPAPTGTVFTAIAAFKNLNGIASGSLANVVLTWHLTGAAGNSITIQTIADGSGVNGSVTGGPSAYVFHFASGVTTINGMIATLTGLFAFSGTYTGTNTLAAGDAFAAQTLAGGQDSTVFLRPSGGAWATALGSFTNTGVVGHFEYIATQEETNVDCEEWQLRVGTGDANNQFVVSGTTYNSTIEFIEQRGGTFDQLGEGSYSYGDLMRLAIGILAGKVTDFRTGANTYKSLDGTKNRYTETVDASGRTAITTPDLSGP